jgi:murein L,D-transpeptidase YcbB/YkuD
MKWALILGAALCALPPGAVMANDPVAHAISTELESLLSPEVMGIQGAQIAFPERLRDFYSRREFRAAWTNPPPREQLLKAIEDSYLEGLVPADYHLPVLQDLSRRAAIPGATATLTAQYDVLLTDAVLRLAYHYSVGKVDAATFDPQWNYSRVLPDKDLSREIEDAIASANVYERLAALRPTHRMYVNLRQELARYRAIEAEGGWSTLPAGRALKPGESDARIPALRARLVRTGDLSAANASDAPIYDPALLAAVRRYQERMGLVAEGVLGDSTIAELNVAASTRISQLRINLDRGRVLLKDLPQRFVVVNIAAYQLYLVQGEEIAWSARVQVGKPYRKTPLFRSEINYLVLNPTWTVPPGILKSDILPAARKDPASITRKGLKVLDRSGSEVDPASIDWSRFNSGHIPYTLRQDPGPNNALGRVKLMFPNAYSVYLHDTPSQSLFERADRAFSSGCVRVENALQLAERVLDDPARWNADSIARVVASGRLQNVTLARRIPVLLVYWTAWVDAQGRTNFRRDVYDQDIKWARALDATFMLRARPLVTAK